MSFLTQTGDCRKELHRQTCDNTIADGTAGMEAEALGLMYEVTNDPALLNQMIVHADQFFALRNNTNNGQIMGETASVIRSGSPSRQPIVTAP